MKDLGKVIVGMSGGVDSAVAAYLLVRAGYEVVGVTLRTWESEGTRSRCCEIDAARQTARQLGIEYHPWNALDLFQEAVVTPFVQTYSEGKTPNPCVWCNARVKWAKLSYLATLLQAKRVATGHYARVVRTATGRYAVSAAADSAKDQSYMLYRLSQEQLSRTLLPLGDYTKEEIRAIARGINLKVAAAPDSQEICFVTGDSYADFLSASFSDAQRAAAFAPGNFVDEAGNVLGQHQGLCRYTVGQRKGLGLALGYPAYVKHIDAAKREVTVAPKEALYRQSIRCGDLNFMAFPKISPGEAIEAWVKIRYHHRGEAATILGQANDTVLINFHAPIRAPAPGQSAVFYDAAKQVLGGGIILA
ncbi:MAG: tRNA 2-thiouridine(34) synthase MnmA [Selenomonadaceae bacterium]|nr:tRNA 2-thiouridine(34) synthase MnmA [Selenomonadaceae bacterium]